MLQIRHQVPLLPYNTFGISAVAANFVESDNVSELRDYLNDLSDPSGALILGGGSNVLFASMLYDTIVHPLIKGIIQTDEDTDHVWVKVGAGEVWNDFVRWCAANNYAGVENLAAIPGSVGASPIQNIGAYGVEVKEVIEHVEAVELATGKMITFTRAQCNFAYRDSFFKQHKRTYLITAVTFKLCKAFVPNIKYIDVEMELRNLTRVTIDTVQQAICTIRMRKLPDPAELGNSGSFFKNPTINLQKSAEIRTKYPEVTMYQTGPDAWKLSAAWIIQQCGWKGIREGNVGTHIKQPLVIVNYGGATGQEIIDFAQRIVVSVDEIFNIRLESEVNVV